MLLPLVVKLAGGPSPTAHWVSMKPLEGFAHPSGNAPAVVCVRGATMLPEKGVGLFDASDVVAAVDGDWTRAILVVLAEPPVEAHTTAQSGDLAFLDEVRREAPHLHELARQTIAAIRDAGVHGELHKSKLGRWVNKPVNVFTLKAQPRVGNLHFTLYGDPSAYDAGDFLRKDQNSYSRGWIRERGDAMMFARLAKRAHERRGG